MRLHVREAPVKAVDRASLCMRAVRIWTRLTARSSLPQLATAADEDGPHGASYKTEPIRLSVVSISHSSVSHWML